MDISIHPTIIQHIPDYFIGVNYYQSTTISESPQMLKGRLQLFQESLFFDLQDTTLAELPEIQQLRKQWKRFGADPSRYRNSYEAMLRRIAKGTYLSSINSGVDLNNFFSLQYKVPIGLYTAKAIEGNIILTIGNEETSFVDVNGRENTLLKMIVASDNLGAFGSPFIDSKRTSVTEGVGDYVQLFYWTIDTDPEEANLMQQAAGNMFTQVNGGEFTGAQII
ncbi:B3/4 domain-containing protein [Paenisporosarcina cavernae]|uniref:B3/B4 tRNA-binding domain-containing protein n=1 Tax=Paenisporosarcina cavernae TaxID=2320858 RepID=A0A385YXP4_9BACL|nr:phenylalanine--tRNA ligase beta subunit-related protein [Paenisporosarcina cavernae]AYC30212.1 hypothetical protein D3873_10140 [Paenisporosarcina cavernae]